MKRIIKRVVTSIAAVTLLFTPVMIPVAVHAAASTTDGGLSGQLQCGAELNVNATDTCATDASSGEKVNNIVSLAINIFSIVVGFISVIMIIIGGLKYITSGGDSANVTGAKNTILYAVIGLVVVALAQFIVKFVLSKVSSSTTG